MADAQVLRRTEAKAFFDAACAMRLVSNATQAPVHIFANCAANERTFLHWLNIAVTVGSVSAAMLGVSGHVHKHWGSDFTVTAMAARLVALAMMIVSIFIAAYATYLFSVRASLLKFKQDSGYENKLLPMITAVCMTIVLASIFSGAVDTFWTSHLPAPPRPQPPSAPVPAEAPSAAAGPGFEYIYERSWGLLADDVLDEENA